MESYVDRDRMIAVSIGASDIRSSILKQKGNLETFRKISAV